MQIKTFIAAFAAAAFMPVAAMAATVTVNFTGEVHSLASTEGDVDPSVLGNLMNVGDTITGEVVYDLAGTGQSGQIAYEDELLAFSMTINGMTFASNGANGAYILMKDTAGQDRFLVNTLGSSVINGPTVNGHEAVRMQFDMRDGTGASLPDADLPSPAELDALFLANLSQSGTNFLSFGIDLAVVRFNLTDVTARLTDDVSDVPLPAAAWLFLAGVGGLGAARRKRGA